jgi:holo-[acyl-carrier protein] synthase
VSTASEASAVSPAVVGIGTDLVTVKRLQVALARTPSLERRLFTEGELQMVAHGRSLESRIRSLAARFAAKEAVMKALSVGISEVAFHEIEVVGGRGAPPRIELNGRAADRARELAIDVVMISMSHDGDLALATAVAVGKCPCSPS